MRTGSLHGSLHVCTDAVVMLYSNCQLCFVSAVSPLALTHILSSAVNIGKDEVRGQRS